jgi:uncharacterized protein involved in propanediol utilization
MNRIKTLIGAAATVFVMFSQEVLTDEVFRELLSMC